MAQLGLDRIFRSIFQLSSCALTRSPGPRSRAWAVLTVFCAVESGPVLPGADVLAAAALQNGDGAAGPWWPVSPSARTSPFSMAVRMPWSRAAPRSPLAPGSSGETQIRCPDGSEMTCTFRPWHLCFRSARRGALAVQVEVRPLPSSCHSRAI